MKLNTLSLIAMIVLVDFVDGVYRSACPAPYIKNGRTRVKQRGRWAKFLCLPGFTLVGEKNAFCRNGKWDVELPRCVAPNCPKTDAAPLHSIMLSTSGGLLNFYCKPGFQINGPKIIYCDGAKWDNTMPSCISTSEKPKLFCDFEMPDICQWNQDLNHDMDWMRDQYKTPTGYSMPTGPSYDHTKGPNGNGYYMYLETSSRRVNDTARLISPIYAKPNATTCLEFWYHMHGRTIGVLRTYLRKVTDPWELDPTKAIFTKSGNHGDVWLRAFINLDLITDDYQIVIEGTRGNGYVSDIAIDDVKIIENCNYQEHILSTTEATITTTEVLKPIESCENRCGLRANSSNDTQNEVQYIICDCDESCFENNRCCPDYVDMCLESITTETTLEAFPTTLPTIEKIDVTSAIYPNANITERNKIKTTEKEHLATENTSNAITKQTTTIVPVIKKQPIQNKNLKPIIFLKPTTPPTIYRKTLKPTTKQSPINNLYEDEFDNDVANVPLSHENSNDYSTSPTFLRDNVSVEQKEEYVERIVNDKVLFNSDNPENLDKIKTEFSQKPTGSTKTQFTFIMITVICGVCILVGSLTVAILKYRIRCRNRMNSGNGDSQSDVRFLTADEVLDFSLDQGYDNL